MAKGRAIVPETKPVAKRRTENKQSSRLHLALPWIIGGAVVLAIVVGLALLVQSNTASASAPGERVAIQGNNHIEVGASHPPYNSDPPTSGPHYAQSLPAGFYDAPQPDENLVHNLEHGHVWITYDCSKLTNCDEVKTKLRALVQSYNQWKVVASPRQNQDAAIGLAAWGWLQKLNTYDEQAIRRFVDAWRNRGPEQTME